MKQGLIHIYHGNGKGKSTAAVGLAVRASGAQLKAAVFQFLKGTVSSETKQLAKLDIPTFKESSTTKFVFQMNREERSAYQALQEKLFQSAVSQSKELDLLVLDELLDALGTGMLREDSVLAFLKEKPSGLEVVLTGRNPSEKLIALADYVTFFEAQKHPFEKGISGRKGIEF